MLAVLGLNWATPFLLIIAYGIARYFIKGKETKNQVNWSPLETVGITIAIYFVSQIVATLILFIYPLIKGWSLQQTSNWLDTNTFGEFGFTLLIAALTVTMLYYFLKRRGASLKTIGFKRPHWRDLAYVLLAFVAYFISLLIILSVIKQIVPSLKTNQSQQIGFDNVTNWQLPLVFISLVIVPPFMEELLVRGFLYSGLKKGLPLIWAALITSLLFGSAHLQIGSGQPLLWAAAIDTFLLSLFLVYVREKTGSLAACIGLHMLKNFIAFYSLFVLHLT